ncbi:MAG: 5'-3' exonuclease H3TH domain-containing protein, partial [Oscillospiraceae bacterium]
MKLLCIDGNSVINRAYFGVRPLSTKNGVPTNAIYGFFNIMMKLQREISPDDTVVAFDVSSQTFRNDQYELYKANRHGMDDDLAEQMPLVKELLHLLGYKTIGCQGYEGDDILGTLSKMCFDSGNECVVATGDRDCLQLINEKVKVCLIKTKGNFIYDEEKVLEDFLVTPKQIIELKALMGDTCDNIPGVKGVGEKTATTLISQCKSLDEVYENIDDLKCTPRIKKLLITDKENAFLSKKLATIFCEVPINLQISDLKRQPVDEQNLREKLNELELTSFFDKFGLEKTDKSQNQNSVVENFNVIKDFSVEDIKEKIHSEVIILLENYSTERLLICIENEIFVIENGCADLLKFISEKNIAIVTFKAKPLIKRIKALGFDNINLKFDVELATYLLNPDTKSYILDELSELYLPDITLEIPPEFVAIS